MNKENIEKKEGSNNNNKIEFNAPYIGQKEMKRDSYRRERGGTSVILIVSCANCEQPIMQYQKDGPGALLRCYLDRILFPKNLSSLQKNPNVTSTATMPQLECPSCKAHIGTPMVYEKEKRLAYRLIPNTYKKKKDKRTKDKK